MRARRTAARWAPLRQENQGSDSTATRDRLAPAPASLGRRGRVYRSCPGRPADPPERVDIGSGQVRGREEARGLRADPDVAVRGAEGFLEGVRERRRVEG